MGRVETNGVLYVLFDDPFQERKHPHKFAYSPPRSSRGAQLTRGGISWPAADEPTIALRHGGLNESCVLRRQSF